MIKSLKSVTEKTRDFSVLDFRTVTDQTHGVKVSKDQLLSPIRYRVLYTPKKPLSIRNIFFAWGKFYIYYSNGEVCECGADGENVLRTKIGGGDFIITPVRYNGRQGVLIVEKGAQSTVHFDGESLPISLPREDYFTTLGNLFFCAGEDAVYYTDTVDLDNFRGGIYLPEDAGKIVGLSTLNKKLVIVCELAVYILTAFGEGHEFNLLRGASIPQRVLKGSVARVLDEIIFACDNSLYAYKSGKVERIVGTEIISSLSIVFTPCAWGRGSFCDTCG